MKVTSDIAETLRQVAHWGRAQGRLDSGDRLVLVAGAGLPLGRSGHNLCMVHEV
jgi:hypothetical protein